MSIPVNIGLTKNGRSLPIEVFTYPGGEVGVRLGTDIVYWRDNATHPSEPTLNMHRIIARIQSSNDIMALLLVVDAIRQQDEFKRQIELVLPYFPYARQDRVCAPGDSFSVAVFARLIAGLGLYRITICDPHSGVTPAVLQAAIGLGGTRVKVFDQMALINKNQAFIKRMMPAEGSPNETIIFIAPDSGALKKTEAVAKFFGKPVREAGKRRNQQTGEILGTFLYDETPLSGATCVMVDDICDGGKTFTELGKLLKQLGAGKVLLYVTHGIFSKGLATLFALHPIRRGPEQYLVDTQVIDEVWTTTTFKAIGEYPCAPDSLATPRTPDSISNRVSNGVFVFDVPLNRMLDDLTV